MVHLYDLVNESGTTEYVGVSNKPKIRFYKHVGATVSPFYKRKDLTFKIINTYPTRKEAMKAEGQRKLSLGMVWAEVENSKKAGSKGGLATTKSKLKTCPHCQKEIHARGMHSHIKNNH